MRDVRPFYLTIQVDSSQPLSIIPCDVDTSGIFNVINPLIETLRINVQHGQGYKQDLVHMESSFKRWLKIDRLNLIKGKKRIE